MHNYHQKLNNSSTGISTEISVAFKSICNKDNTYLLYVTTKLNSINIVLIRLRCTFLLLNIIWIIIVVPSGALDYLQEKKAPSRLYDSEYNENEWRTELNSERSIGLLNPNSILRLK